MSTEYNLTSLHLDVLKEIGNIGAGHAATALSVLIGSKIDIKVPSVKIASFKEIMELVGSGDEEVVIVALSVEGAAPFSMYYVLPVDQANHFVQLLLQDKVYEIRDSHNNELGISVVQEIGNILTGSYLTALNSFTKLELIPSVPTVAIDMFAAIISCGLIEISDECDHTILIDTEFFEDHNQNSRDIKGHFLLLPKPNSLVTILRSLGLE